MLQNDATVWAQITVPCFKTIHSRSFQTLNHVLWNLRKNLVTNRIQLNYTMHKKMCKMVKKIKKIHRKKMKMRTAK